MKAEGYFVWNPAANRPTAQHGTVEQAVAEAERLARGNPGQQFIVLHAMGSAHIEKPAAFKWAPYFSPNEELPF